MKAIVFGGSGFLGSHVADALTVEGHEVAIFDMHTSPYLQKNQKMIIGNILDEDAVEKAIRGSDVVYNFAGIADIDEAKKNPLRTIENNIIGSTIVLEACRLNNVKRYVFASSLYVYSDAGSFYRTSKRSCELIIEDYHEAYNLPYTILRYGSVYGPRSDERNYIYKILKQAINQGKIISFGKGEDLREYIHVEDIARCSVEILSKEFENQYVILTGVQPIIRKDLLQMVNEMLGNNIQIEYLNTDLNAHYEITPYSFSPKIAKKYVSNYYLDLGQGLLQCIEEIYKKSHKDEEIDKIFVGDKK